jgi:hypothetical protein
MRKLLLALPVVALAAAYLPAANAAVVTLTFEGLKDQEAILNFYNGGTGSLGSSGTNYGIAFGPDSLAIISAGSGGSGNFSNSPSGDTIAFFLSGAGDVMNVAAGFTTGFSFYYAAAFAGSVTVFDGLNGTGSVLATLALPVTPNPYTVWDPVGVSFAGTAKSVVFSGSANFIGFDNITLGATTPGGSVPEPSSIVLLSAVAGGFLLKLRKRARSQA